MIVNASDVVVAKPARISESDFDKPLPPKLSEAYKEQPVNIGPTGEPYYSGPEVLPILAKGLPMAGMIAGGMAAAPAIAGMSVPAGIALGATAAGIGAGTGSLAQQKIEGKPTDISDAGGQALTAASWESGLRTLGITGKYALKYVAQSPRILNAMAKVLSSFTKGEYTSHNILESMERLGVPAAMEAIESETKAQKFAPRGTGKLAIENVTTATKKGGEKLATVQDSLYEMREMAGKEIGKVDNLLVETANKTGNNIIDLSGIAKSLDEEILSIETNPILSDVVNVNPLKKQLAKIIKNPEISIEQALDTKRQISRIFENFNKGKMTVSEADLIQQSMSKTRVALKELIQKKAQDLGIKEFEQTYKKYADFVDDYDTTFLPLFGSKEGTKFIEDRFIRLSNEVARRGNVLENIKNTSNLLFPTNKATEVAKNIEDLTDLMILRSVYQDIGHAPSGEIVGMIRSLVVSPMAQKAIKIGNVAEATKPLAPSTMSKIAPIATQVTESEKE